MKITPPSSSRLFARRRFLRHLAFGAAAALLPSPARAFAPVGEKELKKKIGQMLMVGFRGLRAVPGHPILRDIREMNLGGVVLFDYDLLSGSSERNIASPEQVRKLVAELQGAASTPMLIGIDEEGGRVRRLKEKFGFPPALSAHRLGDRDDAAFTYANAARIAESLSRLGINLNFAPVVDLNVNEENPVIGRLERSFSGDPKTVFRHSRQFIKAHHHHGVLCTLKHFPGHGSSNADSHLGLTDITSTWSPTELQPFAELIRSGLADAVMTAHVFNARLDPHFPATLSRQVITGLLRERLGYGGVVISDDLQMGAIAEHYGLETAVVRAIEAGVDILIFGNNLDYDPDIAVRASELILEKVREGRIAPARIEASCRRIQKMKRRLVQPTRRSA